MRHFKSGMIFVYLFLFVFNSNTIEVSAAEHSLKSAIIDVYIEQDGSARIKEKRTAILSEGTENYIILGNLGKSEIKDFIVTEEGKTYDYVENWNLDAAREEKFFKNGIIKTKDGYELSWGIGEYGEHEYVLEYTVTNFIKQLADSQMLFWKFINDQTNIPPEKVTIEITTDKKLGEETEGIWSFGYTGDIHFVNGGVLATSNQPLTASDYVTILVHFPEGDFATSDHIDQSFEEVKESAFEGSEYGEKEGSSFKIGSIIFTIVMIAVPFGFILIFIFILFSIFKKQGIPRNKRMEYAGEYYRQIPYDGHLLDMYYILNKMGETNFERTLTAFILKWLKEERISVQTKEVGLIKKKDLAMIHFHQTEFDESGLEVDMFTMMNRAANIDGILELSDFSKWATRYRTTLDKWMQKVEKESLQTMNNLNYVETKAKKSFVFRWEAHELTKKGEELEANFYKYINYLKDYSLLNEHEAVNVKIWDEIMIWAAVLGLTEVVQKQFSNLYPNYLEETIYTSAVLTSSNHFSQTVARSIIDSSDGGGASSSGGGGSFGGGSGGGTR